MGSQLTREDLIRRITKELPQLTPYVLRRLPMKDLWEIDRKITWGEVMSIAEDTIGECKEKERGLLRLLQAKAEKMANAYLTEHEHTQLSYLSKEDQEFRVAIPKGVLLDRMITYLQGI